MARVDKIFQDNLALIMSQPWEEVKRPVYGDGTGVKVKRILQVCNQYDLRREFPLGSLRPTNLKNSIKEILWIWQKRSVDVKDLGLHIWDQMMFAHDAGLRPAVFTHFIQDMHVYDRHEEQANELLRRSLFGPVPQVTISSRMEGKGFYDFVADDFEVWNYEPKEQIKFEVAK